LDALQAYWQVIPSVRAALFEDLRPGYSQLRIAKSDIKATQGRTWLFINHGTGAYAFNCSKEKIQACA
jgi:hypothetical protein